LAGYEGPTLPGPTNLTRRGRRPTVRARSSARPLIGRPWPITSRRPPYRSLLFFLLPQSVLPPPSTRARGGCQSSSLLRCASDPNPFSGAVAAHLSAFTSRSCFLLACTDGSLSIGGGVGFALPRALILWPLAEQRGWRCSLSSIVWFHSRTCKVRFLFMLWLRI
jgi:hypothetical protein